MWIAYESSETKAGKVKIKKSKIIVIHTYHESKPNETLKMKVDTALCNIPQTLLTRITIKLTNYDVRSWSKFDGKLINIHASLEIFVHMAYFAMTELSY